MLTQEEFLHLLQEHEGRLCRIALAITGRDADAWDALQDAVESAVRSLPELQGGAQAFPGWMRRIVVNRAINVVRLRNRLVPVDPTAAPEPDPLPPPEASIVAREIWGLMEELDAGQRQVVVLRYLADLRLEEIALRLDLPVGTVKSRLHRALGRLRGKSRSTGIQKPPPNRSGWSGP